MLVILFKDVNYRLLTHFFQELVSLFSIVSFKDQIEPELQTANGLF